MLTDDQAMKENDSWVVAQQSCANRGPVQYGCRKFVAVRREWSERCPSADHPPTFGGRDHIAAKEAPDLRVEDVRSLFAQAA
jgi:hypothetical protein